MSDRIASDAYRYARHLMSKGIVGRDLTDNIDATYPGLSSAQKTRLAREIKKEMGVLGITAHDPNLYKTCEAAAESKKAHPNRDSLIATYQTPMCASCEFNRKGSCGLMGGKLVAGAKSIPHEIVKVAARLASEYGRASEGQIRDILASDLADNQKVAAINMASNLIPSDTRAENSSRTAAAILDNTHTKSLSVGEVDLTKARYGSDKGLEARAGDAEVSRQASDLGSFFDPVSLDLMPEAKFSKSAKASIGNRSVVEVPEFDQNPNRTASEEEQMLQVGVALKKLSRVASKALASGAVNMAKAVTILARRDELCELGAIPTRPERAIFRQLEALRGDLTL